ncbi:questin oxidase family protein [Streptomyces sp. TRM64462]|uniref:questin oxidase family protein n=1 Tax=Streptomyces sp. TRM64462 TaxID=2741726 RepID=UPI0015867BF8|nr:questin oxidase family protein [Streptomyces sp. TRM64462]
MDTTGTDTTGRGTTGTDTTGTDTTRTDTTGILDEALARLHASGPEREGWLSNHAPMAVEALVRHGRAAAVHRWLDHYRHKLEDMPALYARVTPENWRDALGDPARIADWAAFFERETAERPWREVLAEWWPRLLPGIAGGATHPVIRVGHAVRTLLDGGETGPRVGELAHALGYWAARHAPLPPLTTLDAAPDAPDARDAAAALDAVPAVPDQDQGIRHRLAQLTALPRWGTAPGPDAARERLAELVAAATHRYAAHAHGEPVMLVHAATAPNAVLRTLPALPRELWVPSLGAAWAASAAVTAAYTPAKAAPVAAPYEAGGTGTGTGTGTGLTPDEVFERAAAHGDDHAIKFADTALDVGDAPALAAAVRSVELIPPAL